MSSGFTKCHWCFTRKGLDERIVEKLNIWTGAPHLERWQKVVDVLKNPKDSVRIAVVGKYMSLKESYKSLFEALVHGGIANEVKVEIDCIEAETDRTGSRRDLCSRTSTACSFPAGSATAAAREKSRQSATPAKIGIPFFGICLGMQMAVVEFARNVCAVWNAPIPAEFDLQTLIR